MTACKKDDGGNDNGAETDVPIDNSCLVTPAEIEGPFPTRVPTSYIRSDIRKGDGVGINMSTRISIANVNDSCKPLAGALVDIWHCDVDGNYSQYGGTQLQQTNLQSVNWFRGRQVTDANGLVTFETIFPGWYPNRAAHIHVHVYDLTGRSLLITQIAFQDSLSTDVYTNGSSKGYAKGISGYTFNTRDSVFRDGVEQEMATVTGTISSNFELKITIRVNG